MKADYRTSLALVTDQSATGEAKVILDNAIAQLGFAPNMYQAMANSPGYLSTYIHGYTQFRENSGLSPQEQELIFLVISRENGCDYCTAAHSMLAEKVSKLDAATLKEIRSGAPITDAKLHTLSEMTSRLFKTRGLITKDDVQMFLNAGYHEHHILEIILALSVKTLSNYANHIFHTGVDKAFEEYLLKP